MLPRRCRQIQVAQTPWATACNASSSSPAARVPELIGLEVRVAQDLALDAGVLAVDAGPHRSHVHAGVVTGQVPSAGRRVRVGSRVW